MRIIPRIDRDPRIVAFVQTPAGKAVALAVFAALLAPMRFRCFFEVLAVLGLMTLFPSHRRALLSLGVVYWTVVHPIQDWSYVTRDVVKQEGLGTLNVSLVYRVVLLVTLALFTVGATHHLSWRVFSAGAAPSLDPLPLVYGSRLVRLSRPPVGSLARPRLDLRRRWRRLPLVFQLRPARSELPGPGSGPSSSRHVQPVLDCHLPGRAHSLRQGRRLSEKDRGEVAGRSGRLPAQGHQAPGLVPGADRGAAFVRPVRPWSCDDPGRPPGSGPLGPRQPRTSASLERAGSRRGVRPEHLGPAPSLVHVLGEPGRGVPPQCARSCRRWGGFLVAICRMSGFQALRVSYRPLQSQTIADFWNRYNYYYKELLVDCFFYPTFVRYFKRHPRLRVVTATFAAAGLGNMLAEFIHYPGYIIELGLWKALLGFRVFVFYALVLSTGIAVSQLRRRSRSPDRSGAFGGQVMPALGVAIFYCLLHVFLVSSREYGFGDRFRFFYHLFAIT